MVPDTIFQVGPVRAVEAGEEDIARIQAFLEENPEYFLAVEGEPPPPGTARRVLEGRPPDDWPFSAKHVLLFVDESEDVIATADVVADLFVAGVWHIGLFIVATWLHGRGTAPAILRGLEQWMSDSGARWSRLGVVVDNVRAERFWEKLGYVDLYRRTGVAMGRRVNDLRVMVKPLAGGGLAEYLRLVDHDRARVEEAGGFP